jgi:hypothetical protein
VFEIGAEYTRDDIHQCRRGSKQSYLPVSAGRVVAACLKPGLNPRAPYVILCGDGPMIAKAGAVLCQQGGSIPVFIKRAVNRWEHQGDFHVIEWFQSGPIFAELVAGSGRDPLHISRAIKLALAGSRISMWSGSIKVGPGNPVEDVRRARELMGLKGL